MSKHFGIIPPGYHEATRVLSIMTSAQGSEVFLWNVRVNNWLTPLATENQIVVGSRLGLSTDKIAYNTNKKTYKGDGKSAVLRLIVDFPVLYFNY